jgi:uncharacterized membrane protein YciS (DUF1049 family)
MNSTLIAVLGALGVIIIGLEIQIVKLERRVKKLEGEKK